MKHSSLFISIFFGLHFSPLVAQVFYLKGEKTIRFKDYSINYISKTASVLKEGEKKKTIIPVESIERILDGNIMYYPKDIQTDEESNEYFMPLILEGKLNLYVFVMNENMGDSHFSTKYMILESSQRTERILPYSNKTELVQNLEAFMGDDSEIMNMIKDVDSKFKYSTLFKAVQKYNLNAHDPAASNSDSDFAKVCFFRNDNGQHKEAALIQIGDTVYSLDKLDMERISIPAGHPIKICIQNGDEDNCDLITPSDEYLKYYEVSLSKKRKVRITSRSKEKFDQFIEAVRRDRLSQ